MFKDRNLILENFFSLNSFFIGMRFMDNFSCSYDGNHDAHNWYVHINIQLIKTNSFISWTWKMIIHVSDSQLEIHGSLKSHTQCLYQICCLGHRIFFSMTGQNSNFTPKFDICFIIFQKLKIFDNWWKGQLNSFWTSLQYHGFCCMNKCRIHDWYLGQT